MGSSACPEGGSHLPPADDLTVLAMTAGRTVVSMAATDGWEKFKKALSRILGRGTGEVAIGRRLEQSREQLIGAPAGGFSAAAAQQATIWQTRVTDRIEERPDIAADLRAFLAEVADKSNLQVTQGDRNFVAGGAVHITSSGTGVAAGVINGSVSTANPPRPGPQQA
jgi:hypothetical protein